MGKRTLLFGLYDQKPLGTRREDLEYSLTSCYKPLLTYLYAHQELRMSLYFSGIIFEWLENEHPEINMLIADMVKRRQIELLSGGYYDPILAIIPRKERAGQIEKTTTFIRKRFGLRPRTAWITEQVWSTSLVSTLSVCGIRGVFQHTNSLLAHPEPFVMQELDKLVSIFPIHDGLTDSIHNDDLETFRTNISAAIKTELHRELALMVDMGQLIAQSMLSEKNATLELCTILSDLCEEHTELDFALPHQAAPLVQRRDYLPSGWYCRNKPEGVEYFNEMLLSYSEMQLLYGKLLYSAKLIPGIKKEKSLKRLATKELHKGESFGAFSISQNGGVYQNYLRKENYAHLIEVDKISRERGIFTTSITGYDYDFDGEDELIYRGKNITAVLDPVGAQVIELDYLVNSWNYLDTFVGRAGEIRRRSLDIYPDGIKQNAFSDMIFPLETDIHTYDKFSDPRITSLEQQRYEIESIHKEKKEVVFSTTIDQAYEHAPQLLLKKTYSCRTNSIFITYHLENRGSIPVHSLFGSECNLSFVSELEEDVSFVSVDGKHERRLDEVRKSLKHVKLLRMRDWANKAIVSLHADRRFTLAMEHYSTTVQTAMGEEDIYQFTRLLSVWELELAAGESWQTTVSLRIEKMK